MTWLLSLRFDLCKKTREIIFQFFTLKLRHFGISYMWEKLLFDRRDTKNVNHLNNLWLFRMIISMTSLLAHTVAHSTRPSLRLKNNNQPHKKFLSLAVSWVKVVKILTFKVNFLCQKLSESFYFEELDFRDTPFVIDIFWKLQFLIHFISKMTSMPGRMCNIVH